MLLPLAIGAALLTAGAHPRAPLQELLAGVRDTAPVAAASVPASPAATTASVSAASRAGAAGRGPSADEWAVRLTGAPREVARPAPAPLPRLTAPPNPYALRRFAVATSTAPAAITMADSLVLRKRSHLLTLYQRGVPLRRYLVALGRQPAGDKQYLGDQRTPEGVFRIVERNPASRYHLALRLSYPDSAHRARAAALGRSPGGDIMIHGLPDEYADVGAAHREDDWTEGCIAVTNAEIEEIWRLVLVGSPIEIEP